MLNWYVLQTAPQQERFAVENLIADQRGAENIWLPEHDGHLLVPGYVFLAAETAPTGARWCEGVLRVLPNSERPVAVPCGQMAIMREVCRAAGEAMERNRAPEPGDRVRVTGGPLQMWEGIVELTQKRMVKLLLPLMGSVTLPADQVVKIASDADPWEGGHYRRKRGQRLGRGAAPFQTTTRA